MRFYVNKYAQPTGEHEVHRSNCAWLPDAENRIYLGDFATSQAAVKEARKYRGLEWQAVKQRLQSQIQSLQEQHAPELCG